VVSTSLTRSEKREHSTFAKWRSSSAASELMVQAKFNHVRRDANFGAASREATGPGNHSRPPRAVVEAPGIARLQLDPTMDLPIPRLLG
jgi:hypothetical protein